MPGRFANLEFNDERRETSRTHEEALVHEKATTDYLVRANEEYHWGRFEAALRFYTRALREDRSGIPAWVGQVQMLVQLGECHEARVWGDKALELFHDNGELLAAKVQACVRLGDRRAGMACSDASLQAPGSSPWRWIVRGEALLAEEQSHHEECLQKALTEPGADWFDRVIISRIYAYYQRFTNAMCYLKEALEQEPTHGYTWFELGNCQRALALESAARTSYERCLELRPDYREARQAIAELGAGTPLLAWLGGLFRRWGGK
jgi:tetratricopeptide (TPR) repeat protein